MSLLDEALANQSGAALKGALDGGIDVISGAQSVTFTKYNRVILPLDGYVFWVKDQTAQPVTIKGSLHHQVTKQQDPEQSFGRNNIIFTSEQDAGQSFNALGNSSIFIGSIGDIETAVTFAFSRLGYYANAGVYHYSGIAIMPHMKSQIIDNPSDISNSELIVSNSLPLFLQLNNYTPFYGFGNNVPLFPSHITTPNFVPPYGSIEVVSTNSWSDAPWLDGQSTHWQLCRDRVIIKLNGLQHPDAMNFIDCLYQYSRDYSYIGFIDGPHLSDEKIAQPELFMIAMRKRIELEVSYQQTTARNIARQLIETAVPGVQAMWPVSWGSYDPVNPQGL